MFSIFILAATISAGQCEADMAFSVRLKPHGYVCLANSGQMYIEPGTPLDDAAKAFLQTLAKTARKLNENQYVPPEKSDGT